MGSRQRPVGETGAGSRFAAIDFETADNGRDSACAVAVAVVEGRAIVREHYVLIRPPRRLFLYSYLHGITWADVAEAPTFCEAWPAVAPLLDGVEFIAAHNAAFDRSVLYECCHSAGLGLPTHRFQCTVKLAKQAWRLASAKLPEVCRHLGIELDHHRAASDARACARIVVAARDQGVPLAAWLGPYGGRLNGVGPSPGSKSRGSQTW